MLNVYQKRWIRTGIVLGAASLLCCGLVKNQPLDKDKIVVTCKDAVNRVSHDVLNDAQIHRWIRRYCQLILQKGYYKLYFL